MNSQTGINASPQLRTFFGTCRSGQIRLIKVSINDEASPALELDESQEASGTWEEDWDRLMPQAYENDQPAYFLFRLDEKDSSGYLWVFISWSPDHAHTRQKMLYAATKATFKKEFGQGQIKDEVYANMREDMTLAGYKKHVDHESAPGPLSREEEELKVVKETETRVEISIDSKHQTLGSLAFPFEKKALEAIEIYNRKEVDYLQFGIDVANETVMLKEKDSFDVSALAGHVPEETARYHVFRFKHTHEGDYMESTVFVYSMPGYSVPIKERMLYSSCKNAVIEIITKHYEMEIAKSVEIETGSELTEEFLQEELHPIKIVAKQKFARPPPPNRGNKRITKTPVA